jgi:restriction system protein
VVSAARLEVLLSADHTLVVLSAANSSATHLDVWHVVRELWPVWTLVALVLAARVVRFLWQERRLRRAGIREIDDMDGPTFERRLAVLFRQLGYRVEVTGSARGDFGCDLVIVRGDERAVVQAKRRGKPVGVKAVQEATAARPYYKANRAYVVANRPFTPQARKLAAANEVELWGRDELVAALLRSGGAEPIAAAESEPRTQAIGDGFCARCGVPVSDRVRAYCLKRRERFAGLVYCYEHQRTV